MRVKLVEMKGLSSLKEEKKWWHIKTSNLSCFLLVNLFLFNATQFVSSKVEKMISKKNNAFTVPYKKNYGHALVQPLPNASLNNILAKLPLIFVTTCTFTYKECPSQGIEGILIEIMHFDYMNNMAMLQHKSSCPGVHGIWNVVKFSSPLDTI